MGVLEWRRRSVIMKLVLEGTGDFNMFRLTDCGSELAIGEGMITLSLPIDDA